MAGAGTAGGREPRAESRKPKAQSLVVQGQEEMEEMEEMRCEMSRRDGEMPMSANRTQRRLI